MKKGYTIKCSSRPGLYPGVFSATLGKDAIWYAGKHNATHSTLQLARSFFTQAHVAPLNGLSIWIEGPRGGRHWVTR